LAAVAKLLWTGRGDADKAIQRIFLLPDGTDRLRDSMGKCSLGPTTGTVCKLSPDSLVTEGLAICEGIENGLALLAAGLGPVWATCGTAGMAACPVLPGIETLRIFADNDEPGRRAANACAKNWAQAGKACRIFRPKSETRDWDELVRGAA
jgi:hypothetical protein